MRDFMKINSFQLTERTGVHGWNDNVQCSKDNNYKSRQSELRFMCTARCLIMLYICVKFRKNTTNGIRVMEQTQVHGRNDYVQCLKGNNSVSRQTRVTVYVFHTFSHGGLHWCEVSWKYLKWFQSYGADTKLWSMDGQTDEHSRFRTV